MSDVTLGRPLLGNRKHINQLNCDECHPTPNQPPSPIAHPAYPGLGCNSATAITLLPRCERDPQFPRPHGDMGADWASSRGPGIHAPQVLSVRHGPADPSNRRIDVMARRWPMHATWGQSHPTLGLCPVEPVTLPARPAKPHPRPNPCAKDRNRPELGFGFGLGLGLGYLRAAAQLRPETCIQYRIRRYGSQGRRHSTPSPPPSSNRRCAICPFI